MSKLIDIVIQTQQDVALYESLSRSSSSWVEGEADEVLMEGYRNVAPRGEFPDLLTFTVEVYRWIRRVEAVAYARKGERYQNKVTWNRAYGFADWAWLWAETIEDWLNNELPLLEPSTPLEEAGKLFIEEKLRWALGRLSAFRDWDYPVPRSH